MVDWETILFGTTLATGVGVGGMFLRYIGYVKGYSDGHKGGYFAGRFEGYLDGKQRMGEAVEQICKQEGVTLTKRDEQGMHEPMGLASILNKADRLASITEDQTQESPQEEAMELD